MFTAKLLSLGSKIADTAFVGPDADTSNRTGTITVELPNRKTINFPVTATFQTFFIDMAIRMDKDPRQLENSIFVCNREYVNIINTNDTLGNIFLCDTFYWKRYMGESWGKDNIAQFIEQPGYELPRSREQLELFLFQQRRDRVLTAEDSSNMEFQSRDCFEEEELQEAPTMNVFRRLASDENCEQTSPNKFCCKKECPICFELYTPDNPSTKLAPCGHEMHMACYLHFEETSAKTECPICRTSVEQF